MKYFVVGRTKAGVSKSKGPTQNIEVLTEKIKLKRGI